jgi:hypothetical protein
MSIDTYGKIREERKKALAEGKPSPLLMKTIDIITDLILEKNLVWLDIQKHIKLGNANAFEKGISDTLFIQIIDEGTRIKGICLMDIPEYDSKVIYQGKVHSTKKYLRTNCKTLIVNMIKQKITDRKLVIPQKPVFDRSNGFTDKRK